MNMNRYIKVLCFATLFAAACFTALAVRAETTYNGANPDDVATWNTATATKLTVEENDSVAITNGEFELVAGVPSFGEGSTFKILDGAKLFATNSARQFALTADNSRILMDGGYLAMSIGSGSGSSHKGLFVDTASNCRWDLSNGSTISVSGYWGFPQMSGSNNVICVVNSTNYFPDSSHLARSMKFYKAEDCVWSFTNAYLSSFSIAFGNPGDQRSGYKIDIYNGYARRNRLIFHDSIATLANELGLSLGSQSEGFTNESFSNRVEVTGTSGSVTLKCIKMQGFADVFRMEGGTLSIEGLQSYMNGTNNRFENAGGTVKIHNDGLALLEVGRGNVFSNCGGTWDKPIVVNGVSNHVELSSGTISGAVELDGSTNLYVQTGGTASGATTVGGMANRLEMAAGTRTGSVTASGTNGVVSLSGGVYNANISLAMESNSFFVDGGAVTSRVFIAGTGNTLAIGAGAELYNDVSGATKVNGLSFTSATNCTLVVSNGTFTSRTSLAGTSGSKPAWWINCPGSAIEFRGRTPSFVFPWNGSYYHPMYIGMSNATYPESSPLPDPVRLRFVPPAENFAAAPIRNTTSTTSTKGNYCIRVYGNAVIEVSDKEIPRSERTRKIRVPLMYCRNSFGGMLQDETRMEQINAGAILPERAKLVYDQSTKTLYCELPSLGGLIFVLR